MEVISCPAMKVCLCIYQTTLTIQFTRQIYWYFFWLEILTDQIDWYFSWLKVLTVLFVVDFDLTKYKSIG